jgi:DNA replication and repair protein RecF
MEVLSLSLLNFRNFSSKKIIFDKNITVMIGPNGSGKSNILEAISLLSATRSVRVETDLDLVKFGKDEAKIEARVASNGDEKKLTVNFLVIETYAKKAYFVDSFKKRLSDFISHLSIVIFQPSDLDLVTGSPTIRRHHLDNYLSSIDRDYWRDITAYNKILTRRNRVLARILEGKSKSSELDFWDSRLLEHGKYISQKREEFFEYLNFLESVLPGGRKGELSWQLRQSVINPEKILKNRERDIAAGMTLSGPHRDDFRFIYLGKDLQYFGSRGEQRMAVLALKLAELEYYQVKQGSRPILALDDIFSELDWEHREAVTAAVEKQQTIITAAEADSVPKQLLKRAKIVELGNY